MSIIEIILSNPLPLEIGDPTPLAWATVAMYLIATVLCFACAWKADRIFQDAYTWLHRLIWTGLGFGLTFLGINKQLDWQTWFTTTIKWIAWEQGWYEAGQKAQILFILGLIVVSGIAFLVAAFFLRHVWRHYWLLLFGALFIARFVITRAAGFYGVSLPELSQFTGGFRIMWAMEFVGASIMALAAANNLRRVRQTKGDEPALAQGSVQA